MKPGRRHRDPGLRLRDDTGALRINKSLWFIVVLLIVFLIVLIDGASVVYTRFTLEQVAIDAGSEAATAAANGGNPYNAALSQIEDPSIKLLKEDFDVNRETGEVTLTIQKQAGSVVIKHISAIEDWATVSITKTVGPNQV